MTEKEYEKALLFLGRTSVRSAQVAKEILVDGKDVKAIATKHKITTQRTYQIIADFKKAAAKIPKGWVHVDLWLPPDLAKKVYELEQEAKNTVKEK